jgi:hypothetical protein
LNGTDTQEATLLSQNGLVISRFFLNKEHCKRPTCRSTENSSTSTSHQAWTDENFVKALNRNGEGVDICNRSFYGPAKIKEGIFVGPRIKELMNDRNFVKS